MEKDLHYQLPDKPIQKRSTSLRFVATDTNLLKMNLYCAAIIPN